MSLPDGLLKGALAVAVAAATPSTDMYIKVGEILADQIERHGIAVVCSDGVLRQNVGQGLDDRVDQQPLGGELELAVGRIAL